MTKLSKADKFKRDNIAFKLREKRGDLQAQIKVFNKRLEEQWSMVEDCLEEYNNALVEARDWTATVDKSIGEYLEQCQNNAETWKIIAWHEYFQDAVFDAVSIDSPEDLDIKGIHDHADLLDELPEEASA